LIAHVLDDILDDEVQLYILGTGDEKYERLFREAALRVPDKLSANLRFDNTLAHKIYAATDLFLMPSCDR
jgi:starch synthase